MRIPERYVGAGDLTVDPGDDLGGIAVFFDFENIVLGVHDGFRVSNVIDALNERGEVMIRRAYADWGRYRRYQRQFLEAGVNMVFLPSYGVGDKNRTDTAVCVDAMEILFQRPHIDTFVIVSGDSDFGVLAHRLRDHAKRIVGISAKNAASDILVKVCHEFIFYETLVGQRVQGYSVEEGENRVKKALKVVTDQHGTRFRASVLKDRMRKQDPTFSEKNYGASSFTRFLSNYEHLVEILDGGMVEVSWEGPGGRRRSDDDDDGSSKSPLKLAPDVEAEARRVLTRSIVRASGEDGGSVSLSRLKDTMQEVAPDFDELGLGFRTFTRFLKAFPDIVVVERNRNRAHPADAVTEALDKGGLEPVAERAEKKPDRAETKEAKETKAEPDVREGSGRGRGGRGRREEKTADAAPEEAEASSEPDDKPALSRAERRRIRAANRPKPPTASDDKGAPEEPAATKSSDDGEAKSEEVADEAAPKKSTAKKKAATKKASTSKSTASAKKSTAKKSSSASAKKSTAKKSSAAEKKPATKKASSASDKKPAAKKTPAKKPTTAKKSTASSGKATAAKKSKSSTAKKSTGGAGSKSSAAKKSKDDESKS